MKIEWKGHSSFLLSSNDGKKLLTDPFDERVGLPLPKVEVDVVTVSHQHGDHNSTQILPGTPIIVEGAGNHTAAGIEIRGIASYHDAEQGAQRGENTIFLITMDGITTCHIGDLGHPLTPNQVADIGKVDLLLIPVGGFYTIDAKQAAEIVQQLQPAFVVPMHYKIDERISYPIAPIDEFLSYYPAVQKQETLTVTKASLPKPSQVVLLALQ